MTEEKRCTETADPFEERLLCSIRTAVEAETPDILEILLEEMSGEQEKARIVQNADRLNPPVKSQKKRRGSRRWMTALAGIAAVFVICFGVFLNSEGKIVSIVEIDVNPGIELSANRDDQVVGVRALNTDGEAILDGMELKRVKMDVAVNAIIGSMVKQGYFSTEDSAVLVTVINEDTVKSEQLRKKIVEDINSTLAAGNMNAQVYNQSVASEPNLAESAHQYGISLGKMAFIANLAKQDSSLSMEKMAGMSMRELEQIIRQKGLDLSQMIDYDSDDSLLENMEEIIEEMDENYHDQNQTVNLNQKNSRGGDDDRDDDDDDDDDDDSDDDDDDHDDHDDDDDD